MPNKWKEFNRAEWAEKHGFRENPTSFNIRQTTYDAMKAEADRRNITLTVLLREATDEYVQNHGLVPVKPKTRSWRNEQSG